MKEKNKISYFAYWFRLFLILTVLLIVVGIIIMYYPYDAMRDGKDALVAVFRKYIGLVLIIAFVKAAFFAFIITISKARSNRE